MRDAFPLLAAYFLHPARFAHLSKERMMMVKRNYSKGKCGILTRFILPMQFRTQPLTQHVRQELSLVRDVLNYIVVKGDTGATALCAPRRMVRYCGWHSLNIRIHS